MRKKNLNIYDLWILFPMSIFILGLCYLTGCSMIALEAEEGIERVVEDVVIQEYAKKEK